MNRKFQIIKNKITIMIDMLNPFASDYKIPIPHSSQILSKHVGVPRHNNAKHLHRKKRR